MSRSVSCLCVCPSTGLSLSVWLPFCLWHATECGVLLLVHTPTHAHTHIYSKYTYTHWTAQFFSTTVQKNNHSKKNPGFLVVCVLSFVCVYVCTIVIVCSFFIGACRCMHACVYVFTIQWCVFSSISSVLNYSNEQPICINSEHANDRFRLYLILFRIWFVTTKTDKQ